MKINCEIKNAHLLHKISRQKIMVHSYSRPINILLIALSFYLGSQFTIWLSIFYDTPSESSSQRHEHSHRSESETAAVTVKTNMNQNNNIELRKIDRFLHSTAVVGEHEALLVTLVGSLIRESHSGLVDLIHPRDLSWMQGCNLVSLVVTWL